MPDSPQDHADREAAALSVLRRCSVTLGGVATVSDLSSVLVAEVAPTLGAVAASVVEADPSRGVLRSLAGDALGDAGGEVPLDAEHPVSRAARSPEPVLFRDPSEAGGRSPGPNATDARTAQDERVRAWAHLPLVVGDDVVGVVSLGFSEPQAFDDRQVLLLSSVADVAAQALVRSRRHDHEHDHGWSASEMGERRGRRTRGRSSRDAGDASATWFDLDGTLNDITRLAVPALADYCLVDLVDDQGDLERVAAVHRDDPDFLENVRARVPAPTNERHPIRRAVVSGTAVLVDHVDDAWIDAVTDRPAEAELGRPESLTGMIAVPVRARGETIGVLTLAVCGSRRYGPDDVVAAEELARRAAVALDVARVFHRSAAQRSFLQAQGDASVDGQLVVDADGHVLSFNRRFVEIWSIPPDVVAQGDDAALAVAIRRLEDPDEFLERIRGIYAERAPSHDELRFRDGRTIERHGSPMVDADGTYRGYLWTFRDITERERAKQVLGANEERFRALVSAATEIVWTAGADGRFRRSASWEAFTGQRSDAYVGSAEAPFDAVHPDDRRSATEAWAEAVASPVDGATIRCRLRRHDGMYRRVVLRAVALTDDAGRVREWVGSVADVEEELAAREELDRQYEVTKAITENATSALVMLDERGLATYVNDAWVTMTGYARDEVLGTSTHDLVHHTRPDGTPFPQDECPLIRALPEGRRIAPYEDTLIRKDGTFFPARIAASPIVIDGRVVGTVLEVQDVTEGRRIREALEARQAALLRLHDVAVALGRATSRQEVADALADEGIPVVGADSGLIALARTAGAPFEVVRRRGSAPGAEAAAEAFPPELPASVAEAFRRDDGIWVERLEEAIASHPDVAADLRASGSRAGAWIPLGPASAPIGVVVFRFRGERTFAPEDRAAVGALARQATQALERVTLLARETRARLRAELLAEVMSELERVRGVRALAVRLLDLLVPRVADYASIEAPGEIDPVIAVTHRDPARVEAVRAFRTARLRLSPDDPRSVAHVAEGAAELIGAFDEATLGSVAADDGDTTRHVVELAPRSELSVPVWLGAGRGVLVLGIFDPARRPYDAGDLELIVELASRVGLRFENARLQEEEHRIALRLQRALLPDTVVRHPSVAISAHYEAGAELLEVGGDWYDTMELPGGRIGLVVGDVVGHGVEAAAAMGRIRSALAALALQALMPSQVLERLDVFAAGASGVDFATVCYGVLDPATGALRYASAGHPPILVVEADGATRWLEGARSVPIFGGIDAERVDAEEILKPGSMLVLYSDGLVERRGEPLSTGLERLAETARRVRELPVGEAGERVLRELGADKTHDDDVVVLCVQIQRVVSEVLRLRVPAAADELRTIRAAARRWLRQHDVPETAANEVLLVLGEAASNAVEHAYRHGVTGEVEVDVRLRGGGVAVRVRDFGSWRPPPADPSRGRGTGIMQAVTSSFDRRSDERGTTVEATVPLESEAAVGR